jgi:hypothetical protein
MSTSIGWTDSGGATTLGNSKPAPGDRFTAWNPEGGPVGPRVHALADGAPYTYVYRTEYRVSFILVGIPNDDMGKMLRLQRWLRAGGSVTLTTGDASSRTYTATLAPEGDVTIERSDPTHIEYTMTFTKLRNAAAADMLCLYP